jgi:hypothetical protein
MGHLSRNILNNCFQSETFCIQTLKKFLSLIQTQTVYTDNTNIFFLIIPCLNQKYFPNLYPQNLLMLLYVFIYNTIVIGKYIK